MKNKKTLLTVIASTVILCIALAIILFNDNIQALLGIKSTPGPILQRDFRGEAFDLTAGSKKIVIPAKFSEDIVGKIKEKLTEKGGMPLHIEKRGNNLPFGIP